MLPKMKLKLVLALAVLLSVLYGGAPINLGYVLNPPTERVDLGGGIDDPSQIAVGLANAKTFSDTLHWWYGPWVQGHICKFYRPLTSLVWWLEYKAFGPMGLRGFQTVHALTHIAVIFVLFGFLAYLTRDELTAAVASVFFAAGFTGNFALPSPAFAVRSWHDGPEMFVALAYIASCWAFVAYLRTDGRKWLALSLFSFLCAICFKEMAYSLPVMLLSLLWREKRLNEWRRVLPFFAMAAVMFAFRYWALQGMGFRMGSNGAWLTRWLSDVAGLRPYITGNIAILSILFIAIGAYAAYRRRWVAATGALLLACASIIGTSLATKMPLSDASVLLLDDTQLFTNATSLLFLTTVAWFLYTRDRAAVWAWLWVAITYLPLMRANATSHALYIPAMGWALWLAVPAVAAIRFLTAQNTAEIGQGILTITLHRAPQPEPA
jgi:hypothetical protein